MEVLWTWAFIFIVFALGDVISVKTKSIISSMFTCSVLFLVAFWMGMPKELFDQSLLRGLGAVMIPVVLCHMGTLIDLKQIYEQWKTVAIALGAVAGVAIFIYLIAPLFIDRTAAIVSAPPIAGGIIAGIQMSEAAKALGRDELSVMATLLVVVQGFVGYPIASYCLKREGRRVLEGYRQGLTRSEETVGHVARQRLIPPLSEKYLSNNLLIAKTVLVALLAVFISAKAQAAGWTLVDKNILALLFGMVFYALGFLEEATLVKANSFSLLIASIMCVIFANLASANPEMILSLLPTMVVTLFLGTLGILTFSFLGSKLLKISTSMAIAIGISALFGFPGTYIISREVSESMGCDEEEKKAILDGILPQMLVAGFVTVSIASVVLAGLMAPLVFAK